MTFKPDWSVAEIVNGVVAAGTLVMVWYTRKMIKKTQNSIDAARRSALATESSVERMKDNLMPHLALDIDGTTGGLALYIRNVGSGLAKICLATIRSDIHIDSVIDEPICFWERRNDDHDFKKGYVRLLDFVLGAGDEFTFLLNADKQLSLDPQSDWLSSISIYYEDVYGRIYRSRLVYLRKHINGSFSIRAIGTENFQTDKLPFLPITNNKVERFWEPEGGRHHIYRPQYRMFYFFKFAQRCIGQTIPGTLFTNHEDIVTKNIMISWNGYPEFHVQIGNHTPFALIAYPDSSLGQLRYDVRNVPDVPSWYTFVVSPHKNSFSEYGLVADGNDEARIAELYETVSKILMNMMVH